MELKKIYNENIIYLEKSKDKIIFKNTFGTIYENKIKINNKKNKIELLITDIANYRLITYKDTRINIMFFLLTTIIAGFAFILNIHETYSLICYATSFIFLIFTMFYTKSIYSVQIVLCIAQQIIIKLNKKEKKAAHIFLKKLGSYKESNPSLMILND
ncbi:hypothetical protein [Flavobacterium sp.]|uniref:hypothetical protein n=1 Tax=Flavobacterium sp. TaxID=239 RepID=UPI0037BF5367